MIKSRAFSQKIKIDLVINFSVSHLVLYIYRRRRTNRSIFKLISSDKELIFLFFFFFEAVAETTAELRVSGTRKTARQSSSTHHLTFGSPRGLSSRRSNSHSNTRLQISTEQLYDTHLPSIRDPGHYTIERENQSQDEFRFYSRSKTHLAETSPTSTARPATASFSSIFNAFSKRSTENVARGHAENDETAAPVQTSASRRSNRPQNVTNSNRPLTKKAQGDDPIDIRLSASSGETSQQQQQQRVIGLSNRLRTNQSVQGHIESPHLIEAIMAPTKERVVPGY